MDYIERNYPEFKHLFNKHRSFHAVMGDGEGSVSIMIRKNTAVFLYRFFRYGEWSHYVHDSAGKPLVYNKMDEVAEILNRTRKVHARYNFKYGEDGYAIQAGGTGNNRYYEHVEYTPEQYNEYWFGGKYGAEPTTENALVKDPYHFWIKGYKAHFVLEQPFGPRKHYAYHRPIN